MNRSSLKLLKEREEAEAKKKAEEEAEAKEKEEREKGEQKDEAGEEKENGDASNEKSSELGTNSTGENDEVQSAKSSNKESKEGEDSTESSPMKKPRTNSTLAILIALESDRQTRLKSHPPYKLGQPPINYVNSYSSDPLALSKQQHQEERDRKRHTSHKFSLTTASDFKWFGSVHGNRDQVQQTLKATALTLEAMLPTTLLHMNWSLARRGWMTNKDFRRMLLELVDSLRGCLFNPVWFDQTGHLHLKRTSLMEREEKKKWEKIDKKRMEDEEERFRYAGIVNYTLPIKHQVRNHRRIKIFVQNVFFCN